MSKLRDAVLNIAKQRLVAEIPIDEREYADFEGAYDCLVRVARAALAESEPAEVMECKECKHRNEESMADTAACLTCGPMGLNFAAWTPKQGGGA